MFEKLADSAKLSNSIGFTSRSKLGAKGDDFATGYVDDEKI